MSGLYIHIPFCRKACHYCDFHFSTQLDGRERLVDALCQELHLRKDYLGETELKTIYFGGGTPSLLHRGELQKIFDTIRHHFTIASKAEITLEANPDDLSAEKLEELKSLGVNRLSIGIQSFNDNVLTFLNRSHSVSDAKNCVAAARSIGFDNISIDLIFGIPHQTTEEWKQNLHEAIQLHPEHISSYSLTIEENTVFGRWKNKGKLIPEPDETMVEQMEIAMVFLPKHGYEQYEISNFARDGFTSRHNSSYWQRKPYLGIGPSAHSYDLTSRQFNVANNWQYIRSLEAGQVPSTQEILTHANQVNEFVMTSLRTSAGCDLRELARLYSVDLMKEFDDVISSHLQSGRMSLNDQVLQLTQVGKLLADKLASDLFIDD